MTTSNAVNKPAVGGFATKVALGVAFVLVVALLIFVLQNTIHTQINFIGWNFDVTQGVSLLGAAVVGAVIALTVSAAVRLRRAVR
ncbi:lipopolysaccharide assembly protein LapA domain-containing protein [Mycobacterium sp. 236(2023)]|uniref:lipopolysaccharide assembly protein LapA domain-containing protein n=1 Tax=Mycobacterium sp. 236(2023) TaxID=3038163 RepID=UPI0024152C11|nr:lipopolysaccharide assembly protein LapA domain-containing protein [Mycobacterium sp. 236(2023)]MDG4663738.1 lipopolysaccharide assembly protein LapA domain-containing protein [Mycobacterium sp. 236(2023)]